MNDQREKDEKKTNKSTTTSQTIVSRVLAAFFLSTSWKLLFDWKKGKREISGIAWTMEDETNEKFQFFSGIFFPHLSSIASISSCVFVATTREQKRNEKSSIGGN